ncbi:hypothetical protein CDL12_16197 [Handroanthus impetiginosus]|uniref:Myb-like domain-containing protein n=1 Tax=Handroanthus impetiginosus TaxID=429701 RepID=A0A2G9H105_9LAMI|nr:hypothetical protein CDL12_28151 [Handroanthus impetiginosus]PIN11196.1 hypothetical protein CDL12_16197 [Handroanthus impetiginosus]
MSSPTTALPTADAVTVADPVEKAPRKFPPPCWTQEEALALIDAYRERWYALRRGYLRTADWDAVAAAVASRCPASPAKSSAQCRHKMEKLRQRYRAEKQRALSFPDPNGRYFSSWFFFENMEAMENGTTPRTSAQKAENSAEESRLKSFLDQNIVKLKLKARNNVDSGTDLGFDPGVKAKRFNSLSQTPSKYSAYLDSQVEDDDMPEDEDHINSIERRTQPIDGIPKPLFKPKSKKSGKVFNNNFDASGGFHQQTLPPGLRINRFPNFNPSTDSNNNRNNPNGEFWVKISNNNTDYNNSSAAKYYPSLNPLADSRAAINGSKRGRNAVEEMAESIKVLGEGFMKMEKAKMEMAREMEAMRMEMEMKRNEMLLESQKQIVDAFLKGLFELKKSKKLKAADSAET